MNKPDHNKRLALYAFLFNIICLVFCLIFFDIKYEVSDDYIVDNVLSGAFTEKESGYYDVHLLFSNILIGYPLKLLYMLMPVVSWYYVFLTALSFASLTVVTYLIFAFLCSGEKEKKLYNDRFKVASVITIVFLLYFSMDLYVIPQFTKISATATVSGGSLFLYAIWTIQKQRVWNVESNSDDESNSRRKLNKNGDSAEISSKKNLLMILSAISLTLLGVMLRFQDIYIALPFLFFQFIMYSLADFNEKRSSVDSEARMSSKARNIYMKHVVFRLSACGLLIGTAYLLNAISLVIWNSKPVYEKYRNFAALRARITDVSKGGYDEVENALLNIGLDDIDYYMIASWNFYDRDIYSDEKLEYLADVFKTASDKKTHSIDYVIDSMSKRDYTSYHIFTGLLVLTFIMLLLNPHRLCWHIGTVVLTFFFLGFFFWTGRVVYRVEFGIIFGAAVTVIVCGLYRIDGSKKTLKLEPNIARSLVCIAAVAFIMNLPLIFPDKSYKTMTDDEYRNYVYNTLNPSWDYVSDKYRINVNDRRPYGNLIDYIESDPENYYLLDFTSCIQLIYYDYKPWLRMPQGYFDENYMYLGGVLMQYPEERGLFARHGMDPDNPYKDIVKKGIYVVDNRYYDVKLQYLKKYYYPNARKELVDTIDGFRIWKYYEE